MGRPPSVGPPEVTDDVARKTFHDPSPRDLVLLDGAEQLGALAWWRFRWRVRRAGGLIITTHGSGRLPTLWRCQNTPELLREIVVALGVALDAAEAHALHARHRGNARDALRELYDRAAEARASAGLAALLSQE